MPIGRVSAARRQMAHPVAGARSGLAWAAPERPGSERLGSEPRGLDQPGSKRSVRRADHVSVSKRWIGAIAGLIGLGGVALVGALHPLPAAGSNPSPAPSGLGLTAGSVWQSGPSMGFDLMDVGVKCVIVLALLFVTLKFLGRLQGPGARQAGRLQVLESRPLAAKASLHLVAVGDRRLIVGLTPSGMVALADLDAAELDAAELAAAEVADAEPDDADHLAARRDVVDARRRRANQRPAAASVSAPSLASVSGSLSSSLSGVTGRVVSLLGGRTR